MQAARSGLGDRADPSRWSHVEGPVQVSPTPPPGMQEGFRTGTTVT